MTKDMLALLKALRHLAKTCEANMAHSDRVRAKHYYGARTKDAQAMYDRVRKATDLAYAAIAKAEGK